jgi:hypothetical protein
LKNQILVVSFFKCYRKGIKEYHKVDVAKTKRGPNKHLVGQWFLTQFNLTIAIYGQIEGHMSDY